MSEIWTLLHRLNSQKARKTACNCSYLSRSPSWRRTWAKKRSRLSSIRCSSNTTKSAKTSSTRASTARSISSWSQANAKLSSIPSTLIKMVPQKWSDNPLLKTTEETKKDSRKVISSWLRVMALVRSLSSTTRSALRLYARCQTAKCGCSTGPSSRRL